MSHNLCGLLFCSSVSKHSAKDMSSIKIIRIITNCSPFFFMLITHVNKLNFVLITYVIRKVKAFFLTKTSIRPSFTVGPLTSLILGYES